MYFRDVILQISFVCSIKSIFSNVSPVGIAGGSLAAKAMSVAWTKGVGAAAIGAAQSAGATGERTQKR